jgi:DNA-binding response OmpR family regulator
MKNIRELQKYSSDLKVLYAEDNKFYANDTCEILENFFDSVDVVFNGQEALEKYLQYFVLNGKYYDIVITDISMPKINGLELTKQIYKHNSIQPVVVISAHYESNYLLEFINIGIEYFIVKPFDLTEMIKVLFTTSKKITTSNSQVKLINNYIWDSKNLILSHNNTNIKLTKKEMLFIEILVKNDCTISKTDDILNIIWEDSDNEISTDVLNPIISRLRKKLPEELIKSIYGIGYKLYD